MASTRADDTDEGTHVSGIDWDPTLETGEPLVDEQHRAFYVMCGDLVALDPGDTASVMDVIDRLGQYAEVHFATEEALMDRVSYPKEELAGHVAEHRAFRDKAATMAIDFRRGWTTDTGALLDYLSAWLTDHIDRQDRRMADYARAHGARTDPDE